MRSTFHGDTLAPYFELDRSSIHLFCWENVVYVIGQMLIYLLVNRERNCSKKETDVNTGLLKRILKANVYTCRIKLKPLNEMNINEGKTRKNKTMNIAKCLYLAFYLRIHTSNHSYMYVGMYVFCSLFSDECLILGCICKLKNNLNHDLNKEYS